MITTYVSRLVLSLLFLAVVAPAAKADIVNMFAKVDCSETLNYLSISIFNVNGELPHKESTAKADELWEKERIVGYSSLVTVDEDFYQSQSRTMTLQCALKAANNAPKQTYTVEIAAGIQNSNTQGQCGNAHGFAINVTRDDQKLIKDIYTDYNCSSPADAQSLEKITIIPHEKYITLEGRKQEYYKGFPLSFWKVYFEKPDTFPITEKSFYSPDKNDN